MEYYNNLSIGWVSKAFYGKDFGFITRFSDNKVFFFHYSNVDESLFHGFYHRRESYKEIKRYEKNYGRWYSKTLLEKITYIEDASNPRYMTVEDVCTSQCIPCGLIVVFKTRASNKKNDIAYAIKKPIQYKDIYHSHLCKFWGDNELTVFEHMVPGVRYSFNEAIIKEVEKELEKYKMLIHYLDTYVNSIDVEFLQSHLHLEDKFVKKEHLRDDDEYFIIFGSVFDIDISEYLKSICPDVLYEFIKNDGYLNKFLYSNYVFRHEWVSRLYGPRFMVGLDTETIKNEVAAYEIKFKEKIQTYSKREHKIYLLSKLESNYYKFINSLNYYIERRKGIEYRGTDFPKWKEWSLTFSVNVDENYHISKLKQFVKIGSPDSEESCSVFQYRIDFKSKGAMAAINKAEVCEIAKEDVDKDIVELENNVNNYRRNFHNMIDDLFNSFILGII